MTASVTPRACVICGKPQVGRHKPFCSKRCADVDLHRWFTGAYSVPVVEEADEDGGAASASDEEPS
jgi:endogenous inhibitor of DNA gyrase (YacG/DUF329 family)